MNKSWKKLEFPKIQLLGGTYKDLLFVLLGNKTNLDFFLSQNVCREAWFSMISRSKTEVRSFWKSKLLNFWRNEREYGVKLSWFLNSMVGECNLDIYFF